MIQGFRFYLNPLYLIISISHLHLFPAKNFFFHFFELSFRYGTFAPYSRNLPRCQGLKWYRVSGLSFIHKRLWVVERSKYVLFEGDIIISLINFYLKHRLLPQPTCCHISILGPHIYVPIKIVILRFHENFDLILKDLKGDFCCEDEKLAILKQFF